jgi:integrase
MSSKKNQRRTKGSGSVFKRANGNYCYQWKDPITRKLRTKTLTDDTGKNITNKKIAEKFAELEASELQKIQNIDSKEKAIVEIAENRKLLKHNNVLIKKAWATYLDSPNRPDSSENTLKGYMYMFKRFQEWLINEKQSVTKISHVTDEIAKKYSQHLWKMGGTERTFNAHIKGMALIFRVLDPDNLNPFRKENITRKIENQQGHKKLTEKQIVKILDSFNEPKLKVLNKQEMSVLFHIGVMTGLRLIDCCLLKWENVLFDQQLIKCIPQKTKRIKREAVIPITAKLEEILQEALEWKDDSDYILPAVAERYKRNPDGIRKDCIKILEYSGLEVYEESNESRRKRRINRIGFHSFRHSFASIMASNGYNIQMLAKILADDTRTLERYYINIDDEKVKDTFNGFLLPTGKATCKIQEKTDSQKIEEAIALLNSKSQLTEIDMQLLKILQ